MGSKRLTFFFLNLGHAYDHLFMLIFPNAVIAMTADLGASYGELLSLAVCGFLAFGAGALPSGWLGDRWSRRGMMIAFFIGIGAASIATGFAGGPISIALGLLSIGIFASIYHPVGIAMVAENATNLGREIGVNGVYGNLGIAVAGISTGFLVDGFGWRAAFIIPGIIAVATGVVYALLPAPASSGAPKKQSSRPAGVSESDQIRVFALMVVVTIFSGVIFNATSIGMPKIFDERLGSLAPNASSLGSWIFVVFTLAAVAQIVVGRMLDRYPVKQVFLFVAFCQIPMLMLATSAVGLNMLFAGIGIMLLVFGQIPISDTIVARFTTDAWRSRVYAVKYLLALGVSATAVPLVAGLHEWSGGFQAVFVTLAAMAVIVFSTILFMPGSRPAPVPA